MKNTILLSLGLTPGALALAPSFSDVRLKAGYFSQLDRRDFLLKSAVPTSLGIAGIVLEGRPAFATGSPPSPEELARIKKGYEQIEYLLANFEQETTVCRENGGECKRDAEPIRKGMLS
jgi:hypothetical protein